MPKRTTSYSEWQNDRLTRPNAAAGYLNAALGDSREMFLLALRKVAQAHQMAKVAKAANLQRETLYHALSEEGNPTLSTLESILSTVGLQLRIVSKEAEQHAGPSILLPDVYSETVATRKKA